MSQTSSRNWKLYKICNIKKKKKKKIISLIRSTSSERLGNPSIEKLDLKHKNFRKFAFQVI